MRRYLPAGCRPQKIQLSLRLRHLGFCAVNFGPCLCYLSLGDAYVGRGALCLRLSLLSLTCGRLHPACACATCARAAAMSSVRAPAFNC